MTRANGYLEIDDYCLLLFLFQIISKANAIKKLIEVINNAVLNVNLSAKKPNNGARNANDILPPIF